jgi:hypothetical protein
MRRMRTRTMLGGAMMAASYIFFVLSEVLGDAGIDYEESAPARNERLRDILARIQTGGERFMIWAGAAVVYIACCLTSVYIRLWEAAKGKAPEVRKTCTIWAAQVKETCILWAAWMMRTGQKQVENVRLAWAFRAEITAEGRPA